MKLYDEIITKWNNQILDFPVKTIKVQNLDFPYTEWKDAGNHQMILRSDMAYELGGSSAALHAIGATAVTTDSDLVSEDEILIIGPQLDEINEDTSYARLALIRVKENDSLNGNALYNAIKSYDYVRYHFNPEGFMLRVSSVYGRESARISKEALKKGLSFEKVGNLMLRQFHTNKTIEAVKLIFITDSSFDFKALEEDSNKVIEITKAIDHIMKDAMTDCNSCSLQEICNEVEGLRELHFSEN